MPTLKSGTVIVVGNRKGGVGKTSAVLGISSELAERGHSVLAVDLDPQGTLTTFAGINPNALAAEASTLAALLPEQFPADMNAIAQRTPWGADIWPAGPLLAQAEAQLSGAVGLHSRLQSALRKLDQGYDYVLIDSPPSVGNLVFNGLGAADYLMVPVSCDLASVGGVDQMLQTLSLFREHVNSELDLLGVFVTMKRPTLHAAESLEFLREHLPAHVFEATVPMTVVIQDAQANHQAIRQFRPTHAAAQAYSDITDELLRRLGATTLAEAA